ncbi:MAG: 50S ribosomal protein L9 [Ignavibacteriae bacterium]|nr:50S ribosomal protein L9 [Ignavibacteriota bacterium]
MKIILKKEHEILGDAGQILNVKNGYARNYLIPKGYATIANESNLKSFEEIKKQRAKKVQKLVDEAQKISSALSSNVITFEMKTGEEDKIFGSVTSQMIYDRLVEKGFENLDRKKIILKEAIKSLGEHEVEVKLQHSVVALIKVHVVKENASSDEKAEVKSEPKSEAVEETKNDKPVSETKEETEAVENKDESEVVTPDENKVSE